MDGSKSNREVYYKFSLNSKLVNGTKRKQNRTLCLVKSNKCLMFIPLFVCPVV